MMRALLARELRLAWRSGAEILNPLWFFLIVITLFPFGVGAAPQLLAQIAPGVVWVAALLAALLVMDRLFRDDWQDGSLEQLMLLPTPLVAVVLVKVVAHWMMSGLPLLIVSPLAALLLGMSLHDAGVLALTLLLGTPTLSFLGAVGVGLTVGLKRGGVLLSLLVLPLAEELVFRGALLRLLRPLGEHPANLCQAVLFAALHGTLTEKCYALGMGLIFGWAAEQTDSPAPGVVLHILNNGLVLARALAERGMG